MFKGLTAKKIYRFFEGILLTFIISAIFLRTFSTPVFAEENYARDQYGLYIRNNYSQYYPSWYPEDRSSFTGFNDPDVPRVVDMANILSIDEEEELPEEIIEEDDEE